MNMNDTQNTDLPNSVLSTLGERFYSLIPVLPLSIVLYFVRRTVTNVVSKLCLKAARFSEKTISKLQDSIYFLVQYLVLSCLSSYALKKSGYYQDNLIMFRSIPNPLTPGARLCYVAEIAVYLAGCVMLACPKDGFSRKKYSDTGKMCAHHIVTLGLLLISYLSGHTIIGVLVMHLHDVCDIIIESTKTLKYTIGVRFVTVCLFLLILGVFLYNRGYIFTKDVLWHILVGYPQAMPDDYDGPVKKILKDDYQNIMEYLFAVFKNFTKFPIPMIVCELLLFMLEVLNIMWVVNLVQILIHYMTTGVAGDIRDPDERKEMEMAEKKKNKI